MTPIIHDHHNPRNAECPQNIDPELDCNCKRKRNRKPYRVCRVYDRGVNYNVNPNIYFQVHKDGRLVFREKGRKKSYETTVSKIYSGLIWKAAMLAIQEKKNKKAERRKNKRRK